MTTYKLTLIQTLKALLMEFGVQAFDLDVDEDKILLGKHGMYNDVLVGALQEAGQLQDALLCAKYGIAAIWLKDKSDGLMEVDPGTQPNGKAFSLVESRKPEVLAIASIHIRRAYLAAESIYQRALRALEVSRTHRIRGHRIGSYYVDVAATTRRDLGAWLLNVPEDQRVEQLEALAHSPFRHLSVTVGINHCLPDGRRRRELVHTQDMRVAPDKPLPASTLLRTARIHLRACPLG